MTPNDTVKLLRGRLHEAFTRAQRTVTLLQWARLRVRARRARKFWSCFPLHQGVAKISKLTDSIKWIQITYLLVSVPLNCTVYCCLRCIISPYNRQAMRRTWKRLRPRPPQTAQARTKALQWKELNTQTFCANEGEKCATATCRPSVHAHGAHQRQRQNTFQVRERVLGTGAWKCSSCIFNVILTSLLALVGYRLFF